MDLKGRREKGGKLDEWGMSVYFYFGGIRMGFIFQWYLGFCYTRFVDFLYCTVHSKFLGKCDG